MVSTLAAIVFQVLPGGGLKAACLADTQSVAAWLPGGDEGQELLSGTSLTPLLGAGYVPGKVGAAFRLSAAEQAFVWVPPMPMPVAEFTVEAWVQRADSLRAGPGTEGGVIVGGDVGAYALALTHEGRPYLSHVGVANYYGDVRVTDTAWHHVAVTRRDDQLRFYVDGRPAGSQAISVILSGAGTFGVGGLGAPVQGSRYSFQGLIDEVVVHRTALDEAGLRAVVDAGADGRCRMDGVIQTVGTSIISASPEVGWQLVVANLGTHPLKGARMRMELPAGVTLLRSVAGSPVLAQVDGVWTSGPLDLGAGAKLSAIYVLKVEGTSGRVLQATLSPVPGELTPQNNLTQLSLVPGMGGVSVTSGLVAHFPLAIDAVDIVGGLSGPLLGGASFGTEGGMGYLDLPGGASRVQLGQVAALELQEFSVSAWIRRSSALVTSPNFEGGILFGGGVGSYHVGVTHVGRPYTGRVGVENAYGAGGLGDTEWHHVVTTRRGAEMRFYVDGQPQGMATLAGSLSFTTPFAIGSLGEFVGGARYGFQGRMNRLSVFNRPLDPAEVQTIFSQPTELSAFRDVGVRWSGLESAVAFEPAPAWLTLNASGNRLSQGGRVELIVTGSNRIVLREIPIGLRQVSTNPIALEIDTIPIGGSLRLGLDVIAPFGGAASIRAVLSPGAGDGIATNNVAVLNFDVSPGCAAPIAGLESLYRGDGDLKDATGRHPGVQENSLGFAPGRVREAFDFQGTGGVAVPDSAWLNRQDFTVDAWVYPTAYTGREDIIVNREANAASLETIQFELGIRGPLDPVGTIPIGNLAVFVSGLNGMPNNHNGWTDAGASVPLNRWSHVAMAVEPGRVRVFLNGVKVSEFVGLTGVMPSMEAPFRIGARSQTFPGWEADRFDGRIDEVGVYTRALQNAEVALLFAAGAAGRCDADLRVGWEGVPSRLAAGETFQARINLENVGNQPLANVRLTNTVPAGWSVTALTTTVGTVTYNEGTISGEFGVLASGGRVSVDLVVRADLAQEGLLEARGSSDSAELSLLDNEARVSVTAVPVTLTVLDAGRAEGGAGERPVLSVPVRLSAPVSRTVAVDYVIGPPRPGTGKQLATVGVDYEAVSGRLEFAPGEVEKVVPVVLLGDPYYELDEVFGLVLSNPVGAELEGLLPVLTIVNDDAIPQVSIGDARTEEGDSGTKSLVFPVTMTGLAGVDLDIVWATTNETARSPFDFTGGTGTVVIPAGTTSTEVRIPVVGDSVEESNEYFTVGVAAGPVAAAGVAFGKSTAVGTIRNDDRSIGVLRAFEWVTPPTAVGGQPFAAQLRAVDGRGGVISNFNGVVALAGIPSVGGGVNGMPAQLLITEVDTRTTDTVEFQNVSSGELDISGWRVSFYDHARWPLPKGTFVVPVGTVVAAGAVFRIQEGATAPNAFPRFSLGQPLDWGVDRTESILTTRPIAVMLQDSTGGLRDFFAASGAEPGQIDIPVSVDASQWPGFPLGGINVLTPNSQTYQRVGWWNRPGADSWERALATLPGQNGRIRVPFVDGRLSVVAPPVLATFTDGAWVGTLTLNPPQGRARLLADDGSGRVGVSGDILFEGPGDLKIASYQAAHPYVIRQGQLSVQVVVTNGAAREATGVVVDLPLEGELGINPQTITLMRSSQGTVTFLPASLPTRPKATIQANVGTLAAGGVVTVEFNARPNTLPGRATMTLVAEARRVGGVGGAGVDWAELPLELVDGLVQERTGRLAWWRAEQNASDALGQYEGVASGVSYGRRFDQRTFVFDGQQSVVEVPSGASFQINPNMGLSLSAWVRPRPGSRDRQIVFEISAGTNGVPVTFLLRNGKPFIEWNGNGFGAETAAPELRDGEWHYVTWTLSPVQGSAGVRIDRSYSSTVSASLPGDIASAGGGAFLIGRGKAGDGFDGEMDELVLFGAAQPSGAQHLQDHAAGALGQSLSDTRLTLTRLSVPSAPITVGRPYTLMMAVTNLGPLGISKLDFRWQNHTSAVVSEIRRDGVLLTSTKTGNVDDADLGAFAVGQGSLVTVTFRVNRDIPQLSSMVTLSAGLRDRMATAGFNASVLTDPDGDGIPSSWETAYGLNPADPEDASQDRDGDGFGTRAEYDAGTDPTSATSFPSVSWRTGEGGTLVLRVLTTVDRDYRLERTVTLRGPAGWELLERRAGTGGVLEFVIPAAPDVDQSYYQVKPIPLW